MRLLLWYSGEHESLPKAEARATFESHGINTRVVEDLARFQVLHVDADGAEAVPALERLGLTHDASILLLEGPPHAEDLAARMDDACLAKGTRFAVRAERLSADAAWRRPEAERIVGEIFATGRSVDLRRPDTVLRVFVTSDRAWVGRLLWERDPKEADRRHVRYRPAFSPVSLTPKIARALVNLVGARRGDSLYDPCCGTGGVLLEAAAMGMQAIGSDLDPEMVKASQTNLEHFGLRAALLFVADVGDAPATLKQAGVATVSAVVTDLPYGRSASTGKEARDSLYRRAFESIGRVLAPGGRAVVGLPVEPTPAWVPSALLPEAVFRVRVHRSLTRHFVLLARR